MMRTPSQSQHAKSNRQNKKNKPIRDVPAASYFPNPITPPPTIYNKEPLDWIVCVVASTSSSPNPLLPETGDHTTEAATKN